MDLPAIVLVLLISAGLAFFAAIGGILAFRKKRQPTEGVLLGLFLGPVGVVVESRLPAVERPEVCEKAWNSFQSVASYQVRTPRKRKD